MSFSKSIWLWQLQDLNLQFSGQGQCSCQMDSCQVRPRSLDSGPLVKGYKWTSLLPLSCDLINEFFKLCNTYWHLPYLKHCIKYFKCLINSQSRAIGREQLARLWWSGFLIPLHSCPTAGIICGTAHIPHGVAPYKHRLKGSRRVKLSQMLVVAAVSAIRE